MTSPWRTTEEAAEWLRITHPDGTPNARACLKFLQRQRVPLKKRGRCVLVHIDDLAAVLKDARRAS